MKLPAPVLIGVVCLSACSTAADQIQPRPRPAAGSHVADPASIEQNGPSPVPRAGWVETAGGWYRSREACLQQKGHETVGTPLALDEECLEPGR